MYFFRILGITTTFTHWCVHTLLYDKKMDVDTLAIVRALKKNGTHRPALRLLASRANKEILFSGSAFFHIDNRGVHRILTGLLPTLKRNFWPSTDIKQILRKPSVKKQQKGTKSVPKKKKKKPAGNSGKGRFFGSIQGSRIHRELEDFILLDDKNFKKKHGLLHPWTKRILEYVVGQQKWMPLQCEYKVFDARRRIGTALDMICVNPVTGHLVFLEFKTGYKTTFENSDGFMSKCLDFMPNSPLNWANIQLTASVHMLLALNPGIQLNETSSYVLRIDDEDLCVYHLDNRFISRMQPCLLQNIETNAAVC